MEAPVSGSWQEAQRLSGDLRPANFTSNPAPAAVGVGGSAQPPLREEAGSGCLCALSAPKF